jgi:hypothetical protein
MDLKGIVNISGKPGLYKVISSSKGGFIVEAIDESRKRYPIPGSARVAALEDISIYTQEDQIALKDVFQRIHDDKINLDGIDANKAEPQLITSTFAKIIPDYDTERVYMSDMRKLIRWYQTLAPVLDFSPEAPADAVEEPADKKAAPKAKAKAETTPKAEDAQAEAKPKKTPAKKKAE